MSESTNTPKAAAPAALPPANNPSAPSVEVPMEKQATPSESPLLLEIKASVEKTEWNRR